MAKNQTLKEWWDNIVKNVSRWWSRLWETERYDEPIDDGGAAAAEEEGGAPYKEKTFDEWLTGQGLSEEPKSKDYYGSFYKSAYDSALADAEAAKSSAILRSEEYRRRANTASQNSYLNQTSNFSSRNENLAGLGLASSGYRDFLDGLNYLVYRGEINANNADYTSGVNDANSTYATSAAKAKSAYNDKLAKELDSLRDTYNRQMETVRKRIYDEYDDKNGK